MIGVIPPRICVKHGDWSRKNQPRCTAGGGRHTSCSGQDGVAKTNPAVGERLPLG